MKHPLYVHRSVAMAQATDRVRGHESEWMSGHGRSRAAAYPVAELAQEELEVVVAQHERHEVVCAHVVLRKLIEGERARVDV